MKRTYEMVRGDTKAFEVKIEDDNGIVTVDKMYFTVKTNYYSEDIIFQKRIDEGITFDAEANAYTIIINPDDTCELEYGRYSCDIEIIKDGIVKTIEKGILLISEEVTFHTNEV